MEKNWPKFLSVEKSGKYHQTLIQSCIQGGGGFEAEDAEGELVVGGRLEFCFQIIFIFL